MGTLFNLVSTAQFKYENTMVDVAWTSRTAMGTLVIWTPQRS